MSVVAKPRAVKAKRNRQEQDPEISERFELLALQQVDHALLIPVQDKRGAFPDLVAVLTQENGKHFLHFQRADGVGEITRKWGISIQIAPNPTHNNELQHMATSLEPLLVGKLAMGQQPKAAGLCYARALFRAISKIELLAAAENPMRLEAPEDALFAMWLQTTLIIEQPLGLEVTKSSPKTLTWRVERKTETPRWASGSFVHLNSPDVLGLQFTLEGGTLQVREVKATDEIEPWADDAPSQPKYYEPFPGRSFGGPKEAEVFINEYLYVLGVFETPERIEPMNFKQDAFEFDI